MPRRIRAHRPGAALAAGLPLLLAAAVTTAAAAGGRFRVEVDEPAPAASTATFPWIEVKGFAGELRARGHDLVIAIDVSESTVRDSGVDLDGDGPDGGTDPAFLRRLRAQPDPPRGLIQLLERGRDFDDSILVAELMAAEALLGRLDPRSFRVGLVAFSDEARVVAPVGSPPERLRAALRELRHDFAYDLGGTHFADAIQTAHRALVPDLASPPVGRDLSIVFLSDGAPTLPVHGDRARRAAEEAAAVAGLSGIRIFAFAIGPEGAEALDVLREMASLSGGRVERVEQPAETVARLRELDLVELAELDIENETTGEPARAVRTFPDGSFDGFVELDPGLNRIRVSARSQGGAHHAVERVVNRVEEQTAGGDDAVLRELRRRTEEMRLWAEMEARRRVQKRELEVDPVRPAPGPR